MPNYSEYPIYLPSGAMNMNTNLWNFNNEMRGMVISAIEH